MSAQIGKIIKGKGKNIKGKGKNIKGKGKNIKGIIKNMSEIIEHNIRVGRVTPTMGVARPRSVDY